jgi:hypothetical protein
MLTTLFVVGLSADQGDLRCDARRLLSCQGKAQADVLPLGSGDPLTYNVADDRCDVTTIMKLRHVSLATTLLVSLVAVGSPQALQTPHDRDTPDVRVQMEAGIAADFAMRVRAYVDLRRELERGLPALTVTEDPAEIRRAVRALARSIRMTRIEAKEGDIFTPTIRVEFRRVLRLEMDATTWMAIADDNPGELSIRINGSYPEGRPLSTVPHNILAVLPELPKDIEYRFLGRHLILLDMRASVILDRIPFAIQYMECVTVSCHGK